MGKSLQVEQSRSHQLHKVVNIVGLYRADFQNLGIDSMNLLNGDTWTLNDWYMWYPWMDPQRIYELHDESTISTLENRYKGNWKKANKDSGAKIIKSYDLNYPDNAQSCTINIMILDAIDYDEINIFGVCMLGMAHEIYVSGLIEAIEIVRKKGVKVNCLYEKEWREFIEKNNPKKQKKYLK